MSFSRVLVVVTLVTGVALAQQGLIVEPWRRAAAPAVAPARATPTRAVPSSGLAPASVAPLVSPKNTPRSASVSQPVRWSPAVVELLVDPWARSAAGATAARPAPRPQPAQRAQRGWVPTSARSMEIVDPWADVAPKGLPLVASHPAGPPRSTIF